MTGLVRAPGRGLWLAALAVFGALAISASSAQAATVTVAYPAANDNMQSIVSSFEKANPGINVDLRRPPLATFEQILLTQLRTGNAPDVFFATPGTGTPAAIQILARANRLSPLPSSLVKDVLPLSRPVNSYKGKLYGMPLHVGVITAYYNAPEFKKMGLKVPKTFDQVLKLCRTVRKQGKSMFFLPAAVPSFTSLVLSLMGVNEVYSKDPKWNAKRTAEKVKFAGDPGWERALRNFRSLGNAGCFNDNAIGVSAAGAPSEWAKGKSLGFIGNISLGQILLTSTPNVKLSTFALPATKAADTRVLLAPAANWVVNATAADKAAANKFVQWWARADQQRIWAKGQGGALTSVDYSAGKLAGLYAPIASFFKDKKAILNPDYKGKAPFFLARTPVAQGLLTGKMSINEALATFDRSWHN